MQKLTEQDVRKIHECKLANMTLENRDISQSLGYDDATIGDVLSGRTWKELHKEYWGPKKKVLDLSNSVIVKINNAVNKLVLDLSEGLALSSPVRSSMTLRVGTVLAEILHERVEKEVEQLKQKKKESDEVRQKLKSELDKLDDEQSRIDSLLTLIKEF